jgi:hypothetical protein
MNRLYQEMEMTPEDINALILYLEETGPQMTSGVRGPSVEYKGERPKGGRTIPFRAVTDEQFIKEFYDLPPARQAALLREYSVWTVTDKGDRIHSFGNIMKVYGLNERDITDTRRFLTLPKNEQTAILRAIRDMQKKMEGEPDKYAKIRGLAIEKAEQEGGISEQPLFAPFIADISELQNRDEAQKVFNYLDNKIRAGYNLSSEENRVYMKAVKKLDESAIEKKRISDALYIQQSAYQEAQNIVADAINKGSISREDADRILADAKAQIDESVKPYQKQIESMEYKWEREARDRQRAAVDYAKYGRKEDIKRIGRQIEILEQVPESQVPDLVQSIKSTLTSKKDVLGYTTYDGQKVSVYSLLMKKLDSTATLRNISQQALREAERQAEKAAKIERMVEARKLKAGTTGTQKKSQPSVKAIVARLRAALKKKGVRLE